MYLLLIYPTRVGEEKVIATEKTIQWYAVYTLPRAEKQVLKRLIEKGIDAWLPLQKTVRQWSDRKKKVELPLLSSYVFVRINMKEYYDVLNTAGVIRYVCFEGKAASIPEIQIKNLQLLVDSEIQIEISDRRFIPGQKVFVNHGSMRGLNGELIKTGSRQRVLVRIESINKNLLVNIPVGFLEHVP